MTDRIEIRALRVTAHVGVTDAERATGQPLELDVELEVDLGDAAASDEVRDTVDYGEVALAVAEAVRSGEHALLERVAARAGDVALGVSDLVQGVTVTVRKLRPPIPLDVATTGVRVRRVRS